MTLHYNIYVTQHCITLHYVKLHSIYPSCIHLNIHIVFSCSQIYIDTYNIQITYIADTHVHKDDIHIYLHIHCTRGHTHTYIYIYVFAHLYTNTCSQFTKLHIYTFSIHTHSFSHIQSLIQEYSIHVSNVYVLNSGNLL